MRNVSDKSCRKNQSAHTRIMFSNFFSVNRVVYEIMSIIWPSQRDPRPCTHIYTPPYTHTHTHKYVILIAFPRQQWFRESVSTLRYTTYIACRVLCCLRHTNLVTDLDLKVWRSNINRTTFLIGKMWAF